MTIFVLILGIGLFFSVFGAFFFRKVVIYLYKKVGGNTMKILNFGSCNIDMVYSVDHIVNVGETIHTNKLEFFAGGKGLNQSIAAARAGAKTYHAGCIGTDGKMLEDILVSSGVDISYLKKVDSKNGHAVIQVDQNGENCIFLFGGSNEMITKDFVDNVISSFEKGDFILLQNEINNLHYIIEKAHKQGLQIVLNPSPFNADLKKIDLNSISYLILNEIEAKEFSGKTTPEAFLDYTKTLYPDLKVVLTLGRKGCIYSDSIQTHFHPSFDIKAVDTTAAGDTFTGYFVSAIAKGESYYHAIKIASCASAITVSRPGAAPSIPVFDEVSEALHTLKPYDRNKHKKQELLKEKIENYIAENIKTVSLASLAEFLGYSQSYTGTVIKKITECSFSELLKKKRCELASELLANSDLSIQAIINRVGYENESFFRKMFKDIYGISPLKFRKSNKANN